MMIRDRFVLVSLVALALGCGNEPPARTPGPPQSRATPATPPPARPLARATPIAEADVRALVETWREAQNHGRFEEYESLYASRFSGIRRNAERTRSFDREGWIRDRRRMFERAMSVTIADVVVRVGESSADVTFTQRWSSGTYADEGPKHMLVVRESGRLRIAVEEMLSAHRMDDLDGALALGSFVAFPSRGGALAILASSGTETGVGEPELAADDEPVVAVRAPSPSIPAALTALVGRTVTTIERARVCEGRIESIRIARLVVPHFSVRATWEGENAESGSTVPMTPGERARDAWNLGSHTHYAAFVRSECTAAVAVSLERADEVVSFVPRAPTAPERTALVRAFERTSRFSARERAYREFLGESEPDEDHPAIPAQRALWARAASVVVFEHDARRVATVVENSEGCGGFDASAWSSFELGAGAPSEHPLERAFGDYVSIVAVFDVGADGSLEAIVRRDLASFGLVRLAPRASLMRTVDVDYLDCPC